MNTKIDPTGLTKQDWKDAMMVQDACNLSGVLLTWADKTDRIWEDVRSNGSGTDGFNRHPINLLFASKVASLTGESMDGFHEAWACAKAKAAGG